MLREGMSALQLSLIAGTSVPVIMQHQTHLTKEDAYTATIGALTPRRSQGIARTYVVSGASKSAPM
jgi:hypothetical protein